jgi:hypothetical protein
MRITSLFLLLPALFILGCSTTRAPRAGQVAYSGFLQDYSQLETGRKNFPLHSYVKPGLSLKAYDTLIIEEPTLILSEESVKKIANADLSALLAAAKRTGRENLRPAIHVTDKAGPHTLRVRWAIIELAPASKLNVVSGLIPQARTASLILSKGTDTHLFVGKIAVEAEVLDSQTGEVLMAGVDTRVGSNAVQNIGSTWGDVEDAFEFWAKRFVNNLQSFGMPTK